MLLEKWSRFLLVCSDPNADPGPLRCNGRNVAAAAALMLCFLSGSAIADQSASTSTSEEPLVTDRPDFTESTDAVPPGRFQLEMGYTYTRDRERGQRERSHIAPEALLRIGLVENLELRIGWDGYT